MRKTIAAFAAFLTAMQLMAFPVYYKEQYYKLYHVHYIQYPDDSIENIYYLEQAAKSDFCNPLYALAKIEDKKQWERYRNLFDMHLNLKLIEQHLRLGSKWDKRDAYFYNAPWKEQNLESLKTAEQCYETALRYWETAKYFSAKAQSLKWIFLPEIQSWEDEAFRVENGTLDYAKIIGEELARVRQVKAEFEGMDDSTY